MSARPFWTGKRVLVTGHTGFKGAWLSSWLCDLGANVWGLALAPESSPSLFDQLQLSGRMDHAEVDLRDAKAVSDRVADAQPDVVFHLAAQALVRQSYETPIETWATNVQGTVHLLEAIRQAARPVTVLVSTTDKVYRNRNWTHPYREPDRLGGHDPYSASKAATELAIASYRDAFFASTDITLVSARAGNVIGGGDWAKDRIVPDIVRSLQSGEPVPIRNPRATRPWQHVLEPLSGYMTYVEQASTAPDTLNFGPEPGDVQPVQALLDEALSIWPGAWRDLSHETQPHEAARLTLSIELARETLGWSPRWGFTTAVARTIDWYHEVHKGADPLALTRAQIAAFEAAE